MEFESSEGDQKEKILKSIIYEIIGCDQIEIKLEIISEEKCTSYPSPIPKGESPLVVLKKSYLRVWRKGSRGGLKILWVKSRVGSNPTTRISIGSYIIYLIGIIGESKPTK